MYAKKMAGALNQLAKNDYMISFRYSETYQSIKHENKLLFQGLTIETQ